MVWDAPGTGSNPRMTKSQMREEKKPPAPPEIEEVEQAGRRFGWLAVIAALSIIGIVAWLVFNGNEQID